MRRGVRDGAHGGSSRRPGPRMPRGPAPRTNTPPRFLPPDASHILVSVMRVCLGCGVLTSAGPRCTACQGGKVERRSTEKRVGIYSTKRWRRIRRAFLLAHPVCEARDCPYPGEPAKDVDHIVRRRAGGSDDPSNLRALSHACHSRRTARDVNAERAGSAHGRPGAPLRAVRSRWARCHPPGGVDPWAKRLSADRAFPLYAHGSVSLFFGSRSLSKDIAQGAHGRDTGHGGGR
jgi:5-methylcytosine-specific restriction protein A